MTPDRKRQSYIVQDSAGTYHLPSSAISNLQTLLLSWYRQFGRDLPWRHSRDPYCIWVSEIMLQQTQVKTVIPYYHRWLTEFPSVFDLAAADQQQVLKLWQVF